MKRIFAILLVVLTAGGLVACGSAKDAYPGYYNCGFIGFYEPRVGDNIAEEETIIENAFVRTSEQPVSTFSADVDTASYTMMRRVLAEGSDISHYKNAIRIEELVNYFDYDYTAPTGDDLFGVKAQISDCPWNPKAKLLVLGLAAKEAVQNTAGNNLVFLIDVSGSMDGNDRLGLLQRTFTYLVSHLSENDRVSIVTYSGKEKVVLTGCAGNRHEDILHAINSLEAYGSTNGQAGLQKAYEIAESCFIEGGNNRIIMASDGDLNVGISSPKELKKFVAEKRDKGVYLSVLGFGSGNYRDSNMEAIADDGNGVYYYIDSEREAERIFGDKLTQTLYTVATDVKLQLTFSPEAVKEYRLVGYENRLLREEDFNDDKKDAGELGAGHTVTVCYELKLTDSALQDAADTQWIKLACRWKNAVGEQSYLQESPIRASALTQTPDADFRFVSAVAEFGMLLKQSKYLAKGTTVEDVRQILAGIETDDEYKLEFAEIVKNYRKAQQ